MNPKRDWWNSVREPALDPGRPIVDPHHHLWKSSRWGAYLLDDLAADTGAGHAVAQTVFVECDSEYRTSGPAALRPVGETEFVAAAAAETAAAGGARISAIVGHADLTLGAAVEETLVAHIRAGQGLFRGIRHRAAWDASAAVGREGLQDLYADRRFRQGFARLAEMGLSFDAWNYHPQIPRAHRPRPRLSRHDGDPESSRRTARNRALPGPARGGARPLEGGHRRPGLLPQRRAQDRRPRDARLRLWLERTRAARRPPTSWPPPIGRGSTTPSSCFGAGRCMFESNYPVDGESAGYAVIWNAFKKLAAPLAESEKDSLFRGTAARVYRL